MGSSLATLAVVLFLVIVLPLFIVLHFITRWKQAREISGDDEQMLEELYALSQRMEDRLLTLERILDDDRPEWRRRI
ncbi:MAG: envelope stress response membrane protein PspB [Woeseiaceae bacterium]|nr:envelope stress response membrane protein PspB [Woeseiaceae bacterium]